MRVELQSVSRSHQFDRILQTIITITEPLSITDLARLLRIEGEVVIRLLEEVQSIIVVPEDDEQPVRLFHTSLRDFLTTEARSGHLFIDPPICHLLTAADCLAVITNHGDGIYASRGLKYAACSWGHHLRSAIYDGVDGHHYANDGVFMPNLMAFESCSLDSWINSIIVQERSTDILKALDSILEVSPFRPC